MNNAHTHAHTHTLSDRKKARESNGIAILHFAGDASMKPWSFSGTVPPSLAAYLYLWQHIARTSPLANVSTFVSQVTERGGLADHGAEEVAGLFSNAI
jgi:hypothetical protein